MCVCVCVCVCVCTGVCTGVCMCAPSISQHSDCSGAFWLQPSSTVPTSPVSTVPHATTDRMMTSNVGAPGTTLESIARQVIFTGTRNVVYLSSVCVSVRPWIASVSHVT